MSGLYGGGYWSTEARRHRFHRLDRVFEVGVARARQADVDTVAVKLVSADALERAQILDPVRMSGLGQEQSGETGEKGADHDRLALRQKGLMIWKNRLSQPWRLARAISPLPVYEIRASATRVEATRF